MSGLLSFSRFSLARSPGVLLTFLVATLISFPSWTLGQAVVTMQTHVEVPVAYEKLLLRLRGEEPTRALFASQDVHLSSYALRPSSADDSIDAAAESDDDEGDSDLLRETIDLAGYSSELGSVEYLMDINAAPQVTQILVSLKYPSALVRAQQYQYIIWPLGPDRSGIQVSHYLDVVLQTRRCELVNRIIAKVTYQKAGEKIRDLTGRMASALTQVSLVSPPAVSPAKSERSSLPSDRSADREARPTTESSESEQESADPAPSLQLTFRGIKTPKGAVRVALFRERGEFEAFDARKAEEDQGAAFRRQAFPVTEAGELKIELKDVPPGRYVIAAFHDRDANGKLNSNFVGLPSEPYGFSQDARGQLGPPDFDAAAIAVEENRRSFTINLK